MDASLSRYALRTSGGRPGFSLGICFPRMCIKPWLFALIVFLERIIVTFQLCVYLTLGLTSLLVYVVTVAAAQHSAAASHSRASLLCT